MISLVLGFLVFGLGMKGFAAAGLPLTSRHNVTGRRARIIGGCCLALAVLLLIDGLLWVGRALAFAIRVGQ